MTTPDAPARHDVLRERLTALGFTPERPSTFGSGDTRPTMAPATLVEVWSGGAAAHVFIPLDETKGDYGYLCERAEQQLAPYEQVFALGQRAGLHDAVTRLAHERDQVAIGVRDGLPEYGHADPRFLDGVSHAWSVLNTAAGTHPTPTPA